MSTFRAPSRCPRRCRSSGSASPPRTSGRRCGSSPPAGRDSRAREVVAAAGDHVADPAARVGHVARVPRNDVNVQVEDRLPGRPPDVDPDVVAVGCMRRLDRRLRGLHRLQQLPPFLAGRLEPARDVPARDEQRVPVRHRERVPQPDHPLALVEAAVGRDVAERAGAFRHGARAAFGSQRVMTSAPSSPASRHSAHRHAVIGRRAVRTVWQTGQRCSQIRPAAALRAFRFPCDASRVRIRGSNPAARTRACHSGPCGFADGPCSRCTATWASSWQRTSSSRRAGASRRSARRTIRPSAGRQRASVEVRRRLNTTETDPASPGRSQSFDQAPGHCQRLVPVQPRHRVRTHTADRRRADPRRDREVELTDVPPSRLITCALHVAAAAVKLALICSCVPLREVGVFVQRPAVRQIPEPDDRPAHEPAPGHCQRLIPVQPRHRVRTHTADRRCAHPRRDREVELTRRPAVQVDHLRTPRRRRRREVGADLQLRAAEGGRGLVECPAVRQIPEPDDRPAHEPAPGHCQRLIPVQPRHRVRTRTAHRRGAHPRRDREVELTRRPAVQVDHLRTPRRRRRREVGADLQLRAAEGGRGLVERPAVRQIPEPDDRPAHEPAPGHCQRLIPVQPRHRVRAHTADRRGGSPPP